MKREVDGVLEDLKGRQTKVIKILVYHLKKNLIYFTI